MVVTVTVLEEPTNANTDIETLLNGKTKIGEVTVTYDDATLAKETAFESTSIRVTPGTKAWSSLVYNLPTSGPGTGDNAGVNVNYLYYIVEKGSPISGYLPVTYQVNGEEATNAVGETGDTVVLINKEEEPQTVNISITKTWAGDEDDKSLRPSAAAYAAMVHLYSGSTEITGQSPTVTDNGNNTYTVTYTGLPAKDATTGADISYTVKEDAVTGYTPSTTDGVADGGSLTNSRDKGSLNIRKTATVNGQSDTAGLINGDYTFTVTATGDVSADHVTVKITVTNGVATAAEKVDASVPADVQVSCTGGVVTVSGLPTGTYTVEETLTAEQTSAHIALESSEGTTAIVTKDPQATVPTASFVNNKDVGRVNVTKKVKVNSEDSTELNGKTITIGLYQGDSEPGTNATPYQTATMTLTGASTTPDPALFTNLDLGTYWVYELDAENHPMKNGGTLALENRSYTVSEAAPSVTLDEGGDAETVEITNAREEGSLKITKQVTVGDNAWTDATKASPVDGSYVFGVYADANCTEPATDANGAAVADVTITITNGQAGTVEVPQLVAGATYYIKEKSAPNSAITMDTQAHGVTVVAGATGTGEGVPGAEITNDFPTTDVPVKKVWDVEAPDFVTSVEFTLYTDAAFTTVAEDVNGNAAVLTLSAPDWAGSFTDLPEKDASDQTITYYLKETAVSYTGGTVTIDGTAVTGLTGDDIAAMFGATAGTVEESGTTYKTITNRYDTTDVEVTKKWDGDQWPEDVTAVVVTLKANGETADVTAAANGNSPAATLAKPATGSTATAGWTDLPVKDVDGSAITYTVEETSVTMGGVTYTQDGEKKLSDYFEITTSPATVSEGAAEITNKKIVGKLTVTKTVRLNGDLTDVLGTEFWVAVFSDAAATTRVAGPQKITTTGGMGTTEFTGLIPGTYYVFELTAEDGEPITGTSGEIGGYTYTVTTDNTDAVITKADLEGTASIDNNKTEKGTLTVTKAVLYNDAPDSERAGETITVGLYADAEGQTPVKRLVGEAEVNWTETITLGDNGTGEATFSELDYGTYYVFELDDEGAPVTGTSGTVNGIAYQVAETGNGPALDHDSPTASIDITNSKTETGSLQVIKKLTKNTSPETVTEAVSFTVGLYKVETVEDAEQETFVESKQITVPANASESPAVTFDELEIGATYRVYEMDGENKVADGGAYHEYTVRYEGNTNTVEVTRAAKDDGSVTVTNDRTTTELEAVKAWTIGGEAAQWPAYVESVTFTLQKTIGSETTPVTTDDGITNEPSMTIHKDETAAWTDLPVKLEVGGEYVDVTYSVAETAVTCTAESGLTSLTTAEEAATVYGAVYADGTVTNTIPTTEIAASKTWSDPDRKAAAVEFTLMADGAAVTLKADGTALENPVVVTGEEWTTTFSGLLAKNGTEDITYTVVETAVYIGGTEPGNRKADVATYFTATTNDTGTEITNTPVTVTLDGQKTWVGAVPEDLTLQLLAGEDEVALQSENADAYYYLTWNKEQNPWTYHIGNLPKYDANGAQIVYKVVETPTDAYAAEATETAGTVDEATGNITGADFTNTEKITIHVLKTDAVDKTPLAGATFTLVKLGATEEEEDETLYTAQPTDAKGQLSFSGLLPGSYQLTEVDPPANYLPTGAAITFTIEMESDHTLSVTKTGGDETVSYDRDDREFTVPNTKVTGTEAGKEWYDGEAVKLTGEDIAEAIGETTVTLTAKQYYLNGDEKTYTGVTYPVELDGTADAADDVPEAGTAGGYEDEAWHATWSNLPANGKVGEQAVAFLYEVEETAVEGAKTLEDVVVVTEEGTVKNYLNTGYTVTKNWAEGYTPKEGTVVEFTLSRTTPEETSEETPEERPTFSRTVRMDHEGKVIAVDGVTVVSDPEGSPWTYTWQSLPTVDATGAKYTYSAAEKVWFVSGETETEITDQYETENEGGAFTNTPVTTGFDFNKVWLLQASEAAQLWPEGKQIEVTIGRRLKYEDENATTTYTEDDTDFALTYTLTTTEATSTNDDAPNVTVTAEENIYNYALVGLEKYGAYKGHNGEWEYFVSETPLEGYSTTYVDAEGTTTQGKTYDGGTIRNSLISISLPSTGGMGTTVFYTTGVGLLILAAIWFVRDQRKRYYRNDI